MICGGLAGGSTSATEMFERLVEYLEGAQDSFIENCTWLVETLIGKSSLKRMKISLVDFTLGLSVGMIEPMTVGISTEIAEQTANIQDKSSYLLGKICGNVITSMYFSGIAAGSGLGAVVALPTGGGNPNPRWGCCSVRSSSYISKYLVYSKFFNVCGDFR